MKLLVDMGIEFEDYRYLDRGVHLDDVAVLSTLKGIIRTSDLDSNENFDLLDENTVADIIQSNPRVLQRPILISGGVAVIGRPPEKILTLLP